MINILKLEIKNKKGTEIKINTIINMINIVK